jgi:hypothetical protein
MRRGSRDAASSRRGRLGAFTKRWPLTASAALAAVLLAALLVAAAAAIARPAAGDKKDRSDSPEAAPKIDDDRDGVFDDLEDGLGEHVKLARPILRVVRWVQNLHMLKPASG